MVVDASKPARCGHTRRLELESIPSGLAERLTWLGRHPSVLVQPRGLEQASKLHEANIGRFRGQIRAFGFVAPDTLGVHDLAEVAYAEMSRHRIEAWGNVVADVLASASTPNGAIDAALFAGPLVTSEIANRLAHGLSLFNRGDFDAAAHVVLPRLEVLIRRMAIVRRIPALQIVYSSLGNISCLNALLSEIAATSDADDRGHWEYLHMLLVEPRAAGIRNTLSHGLRSDSGFAESVSRQEAALLIHAGTLLAAVDDDGRGPSGSP